MRPRTRVLGLDRVVKFARASSAVSSAAPNTASTRAPAAADPGAHLRQPPPPARDYVPTAPLVEDGRERSAILGKYPTRTKINFAARRSRPDRTARWHHDPIAVMQNTPLRRCAVTNAHLHTAYMLRLSPVLVRDKAGAPRVLAAPELLHPRYARRRAGHGAWVALKPDLVARLGEGESRRTLASVSKGPPKVADSVVEQVGAELVLRVGQELALLRARIASARPPQAGECVDACCVLRSLSAAEVEGVARGAAPPGAVAVMDVRFGARSRLTPEERECPTVPMLRREGGRNYGPDQRGHVPLFPLHALLGADPRCAALVQDVLAAQRGFVRRCAEAAGGHVITPTAEVEAHRAEEEAALVAVQIPQMDEGRGGGVPFVVALWRVALWRGEGWDLVEKAEGEDGEEGGKDGEGP
ncbi:hypothetical protein CspeluHIS016_0207010 [Cutaneotrichosporon spelunceum]|uniref:Uncharacterized protein n=1 Tax=Cutaneotrichosporon spelunceum TaxID=1672016 RepID=A0AAD3TSJ4_9TREE|nr:hypothetical protein CspeluHIS016_0207010 [Cutaneotrichosporon spelunceum]